MRFGGEFLDFVERQNLSEESKKYLVETSKKIMTRTELLANNESQNCQIVIGEVQSGKTMSFTALTALAHENGFPLVVVLAGTKDNLLKQTAERLKNDLQTFGNGGANPWQLIVLGKKAKTHEENVKTLKKTLEVWKDKEAPNQFKSTVIIVALKNRTRIDSIDKLIKDTKAVLDLNNLPVLIIDDEIDEAGLNLQPNDPEGSAVYAAINRLRGNLRRHSYVGYTATPQGPLVIRIQDSLSPKYVTLMKSGSGYLGGEELFLRNDSKFVKTIPENERNVIITSTFGSLPPKSLKEALAYYLLALCIAQNRNNPRPISMLIHPSVKKDDHKLYLSWVEDLLEHWKDKLKHTEESIFETELKNFSPAELELRETVDLPNDWDLRETLKALRFWINKIEVRIINSDKNDIDADEWRSKSGWILVGGSKLSRGYTIENLAVTYMPRNLGNRQVDVIQQRGRFFGYKRKYKDLLRGWFFDDGKNAYIDYVHHEKIMRQEMEKVDNSDGLLKDWRRKFLLDSSYSLVRNKIISLDINSLSLKVFKQQQLYASNLEFDIEKSFKKIIELSNSWQIMKMDKRKNHRNYFSYVNFESAMKLLFDWKMSPANRSDVDNLIWAIQASFDRNLMTKCGVVLMDYLPQNSTQYERDRYLPENSPIKGLEPSEHTITNLFQGSDKAVAVNYPGDDSMKFEDALTLQIHRVKPNFFRRGKPTFGKKEYPTVLAIAILFPDGMPGVIYEV